MEFENGIKRHDLTECTQGGARGLNGKGLEGEKHCLNRMDSSCWRREIKKKNARAKEDLSLLGKKLKQNTKQAASNKPRL